MKKRIGSFALIVIGIVLMCSTAYADNHQVHALPTGHSLESAIFTVKQPVEKTPPASQKLPQIPEVKGLPPEEEDGRRKFAAKWVDKDEADDASPGSTSHKKISNKYEIPRRHTLRGFHLL